MVFILMGLWGSSHLGFLSISPNDLEASMLLFLLSFSIISAWFFERIREKTFNESYQSGLRHETLMQALDEVYYRVGMDGIILEIGEAIYALTGFTPIEVENRPIHTFYADPATREGYVNALKKSGNVKNYPIEIVGKYGQHVMISMSSRMFFNEAGQPIYIEGLIRDITKQRKTENERLEHLDHLRSLSVIEATLAEQDFDVSLQLALEEIMNMFQADRVFLVRLGLHDKDDGISSTTNVSFLAENAVCPSFDAKSFIDEGEVKAYLSSVPNSIGAIPLAIDTMSMFSPQMVGEYKLCSHLMTLFSVKPNEDWVLGIHQCEQKQIFTEQRKRLFIDVSHRIRGALGQLLLQKDLQETVERVEVASKAKSEFLATMSHELRTPLHGLIGLLDLLGADIRQLPQEQQRNLLLAQTSSQVLSSLIDDVLDLAKIESGKVKLRQHAFMLEDALQDALVPFVMKAREKGLNLSLEMKHVNEKIKGDVVRLRQVLLNLVGNAIKFTSKGYVRIVVTQSEATLQVNIEDSGIGIEKMKHEEVFKPFSQVHDVTILGDNLQEKGTGLGTTISQHFVEMMGGTLTLQSESGIGSTLSIRLPLQAVGDNRVNTVLNMDDFAKRTDDCIDEADHQAVVQHKAWKVLLAEDDPVGRRVAVKRLERSGFTVDAVVDGKLAWEKVQQEHYDLLLTDIRMPGLDGMQLTKIIRVHEAEKDIKPMLIIGLSAYALEEVKHDALASGMDEFVSKPVDMRVLMEKLEKRCDIETSGG
ncbi:MAG: ATP-binding protein [Ghiorsea sp.]